MLANGFLLFGRHALLAAGEVMEVFDASRALALAEELLDESQGHPEAAGNLKLSGVAFVSTASTMRWRKSNDMVFICTGAYQSREGKSMLFEKSLENQRLGMWELNGRNWIPLFRKLL